jgi:hypothetical protein
MFTEIKNVIDIFTKNNMCDDDGKTIAELEKIKNYIDDYIDDIIDTYNQKIEQQNYKLMLNEYLKNNNITQNEFNELSQIIMIRDSKNCYNYRINRHRDYKEQYIFKYKNFKYLCYYSHIGYYEDRPRFEFENLNTNIDEDDIRSNFEKKIQIYDNTNYDVLLQLFYQFLKFKYTSYILFEKIIKEIIHPVLR